jgi:hypothetical protein
MNAFLPGDKCYIPELEQHGRVVTVMIGYRGTEYNVRYFDMDKVVRECFFFDDELSAPSGATV